VVILPHPNRSTLFGLVLGLAKPNPNLPTNTPNGGGDTSYCCKIWFNKTRSMQHHPWSGENEKYEDWIYLLSKNYLTLHEFLLLQIYVCACTHVYII